MPDSLLRESPQYWYADPHYDQCCDDTQLHVPYTAYTFLVAGYVGDVRFGGPTGPGWALACVESTSELVHRVDGVGRPTFDFHTGPGHLSAKAVILWGPKFCARNNSTTSESTLTVSEPSFRIETSFRYAGILSYIS